MGTGFIALGSVDRVEIHALAYWSHSSTLSEGRGERMPRDRNLRVIWRTLLWSALMFSAVLASAQAQHTAEVQLHLSNTATPIPRVPNSVPRFRVDRLQSFQGLCLTPKCAAPVVHWKDIALQPPRLPRIDARSSAMFMVSSMRSEHTDPVDSVEYYARHIPWGGPLILRVCRQAKAHPRVVRVLKFLVPAGD